MSRFVIAGSIFVTAALTGATAFAQCPNDDVLLTNQTAVQTFTDDFPNCVDLTGDLVILGTVVDLSPLGSIESVAGSLQVRTSTLETASFPQLTTVGDLLSVDNNTVLTNIEFPALQLLDDGIFLGFNPVLGTFALDITGIGGNIAVVFNDSLAVLDLSSLVTGGPTNTGDNLDLRSNPSLTDVDLSSLVTVNGRLWVEDNAALTELYLPVLVEVGDSMSLGRDLEIAENHGLRRLDLPSLTTVGGELIVRDNSTLFDCCSLQTFLDLGSPDVLIENNAMGCDSIVDIERSCRRPAVEVPTLSRSAAGVLVLLVTIAGVGFLRRFRGQG